MTRPLRVGVQLPEVEWAARWRDLAALARLAEDVGFDSLWVGDHLLYRPPHRAPQGPWEAWSVLAALAAITERVALGPLVASAGFHNPAMLAKKAATVDEISGGRLIVGLGAGWNEIEYRAYGFPYDRRVDRFEEAFTIIHSLLRDGEVDFEGRYHQAHDCRLVPPPRPGGPPLMVGSRGPRMLSITLPHVDAWNAWYTWFGNRPQGLRPLLAELDQACLAQGRDPATLERTTAAYVQLPGGAGREAGDPTRAQAPPLTGDAAALAATLTEYAELGIGHVQLVLDPITAPSIEAMAPMLALLDAG